MDDLRDVWFFDRFAPYYDRLMAEPDAEAIAVGLAAAERDVDVVLDVAGGTGRALPGLDVSEPVVLDASGPMLSEARANGYTGVQGDAAALPVADDSVDAVLVVDALHLLSAVDEVIAEAARVLRPGGVLVVREMDPETLKGRLMRTVERTIGFHSNLLPPDETTARMAAAGLDASVPSADWTYTAAGVLREEGAADESATP